MATQAQKDFFFGTNSNVRQYETIEFTTDPNTFQSNHLYVRNARDGITATTELGVSSFIYLPMRIRPQRIADNLEFGISIEIGVSDAVAMRKFVKAMLADSVEWYCIYRTFSSTDLTTIMTGPHITTVNDINTSSKGVKIECATEGMNNNRTGEIYSYNRFPGLLGWL